MLSSVCCCRVTSTWHLRVVIALLETHAQLAHDAVRSKAVQPPIVNIPALHIRHKDGLVVEQVYPLALQVCRLVPSCLCVVREGLQSARGYIEDLRADALSGRFQSGGSDGRGDARTCLIWTSRLVEKPALVPMSPTDAMSMRLLKLDAHWNCGK